MIAPCFLVLHLATLATDRLRQVEPILQGQPLAAWTTSGNRRLLTAVDAPKTTLHAGQALADARPCTVRSGIAAHAVISDIVDAPQQDWPAADSTAYSCRPAATAPW